MATNKQRSMGFEAPEKPDVEHIVTLKKEGIEHATIDAEWLRMEKKLVQKLDMTLMPIIWTLDLFNYLDRNNIA